MYVCFTSMQVYVPHECLVSMKARRRKALLRAELSFQPLIPYVLEISLAL